VKRTRAIAVAYSGGRDSTALLHATACAAAAHGVVVHALHVHHGLSPHAHAWLAHCASQCKRWAAKGLPIEFHEARLTLSLRPRRGVEAQAREGRYAALAQMAREAGCDAVLLAHHREDQAETFLLQALRGAGVAGLAAMPAAAHRAGIAWLRPWLAQPRAAIEAYVRKHRLRYVDDDSNTDARFARNRLRRDVWPALAAAFPQAGATLADTARWAQDAADCLDALAQHDLQAMIADDGLPIAALFALGTARGRNAMRAWLHARLGVPASAALVDRLWEELPARGPARWPGSADTELRRYRGVLRAAPVAESELRAVADMALPMARPGRYRVADWGGAWVVRRVRAGGVRTALLEAALVRSRRGGEQFQRAPNTPPRALKKQFQAAGLPAWQRDAPLLFSGEQLLFVPGLGADARALAAAGEPQCSIAWEPDSAASA
jgi:tRNA(Ile)-lysidine synthase